MSNGKIINGDETHQRPTQALNAVEDSAIKVAGPSAECACEDAIAMNRLAVRRKPVHCRAQEHMVATSSQHLSQGCGDSWALRERELSTVCVRSPLCQRNPEQVERRAEAFGEL